MKKFAILLLALLLALPLTGCQGGQTGHSINVYNWGEYIDESIFDDFEAETGIHVNYKTFASNEMLYSAIKGGGNSYDVIIPSDYMVARMGEEGLLMELDYSKIPNAENIDERYLHPAYDTEQKYSLPTVVPADSRPLSWPPIGALPRNQLASSATGGASPISPYAGEPLRKRIPTVAALPRNDR